MRTFLKKSVVFVLIIFLLLVSIELVLLTKPNVYSYKRKYIENHLNDISVILMGNSHIDHAVVPELLCDSIFNFAIAGRGYSIDVELAERYIPQMDNIKIVVVPFDYVSFGFGRLDNKYDATPQQTSTFRCMYTKYFGVRQYGFYYWSEIINSHEKYMARLTNSKNTNDFCDSLGFASLDVANRPENWYEQWVPGKLIHNKGIDKQQYNDLLCGYEKICRLCSERGARLVLISAPVYKTFQDAIEPSVLNDMQQIVDSLKSKYCNVEYYNFLFTQGFDDEDFFDAGHLTETGAIKFSKMLKDSLWLE